MRTGPGDFFFENAGARIVSATLLASPGPRADPEDANACAAVFPETNAIIRLLFGSGVREQGPDGVVNLGMIQATGTAEEALARAQGMFQVESFGRGEAELLGLGDVVMDGDNVLDLCLKLPRKLVLPRTVIMPCTPADDPAEDFIVRDPLGNPCEAQSFRVSLRDFDFFSIF